MKKDALMDRVPAEHATNVWTRTVLPLLLCLLFAVLIWLTAVNLQRIGGQSPSADESVSAETEL